MDRLIPHVMNRESTDTRTAGAATELISVGRGNCNVSIDNSAGQVGGTIAR